MKRVLTSPKKISIVRFFYLQTLKFPQKFEGLDSPKSFLIIGEGGVVGRGPCPTQSRVEKCSLESAWR